MSDLLGEARAWVQEVHPHARHLLRTEDWLVTLQPAAAAAAAAGERLRLAAVLHDIERAFPDPDAGWDSARDWSNGAYSRWHQDRCADIASQWLGEEVASQGLIEGVDRLIRVHEEGGWPEADLLQAADSLSFLETMVPLVLGWVSSGRASPQSAAAKLQNCVDRMHPSLGRARGFAEPLLRDALDAVKAKSAGAPT